MPHVQTDRQDAPSTQATSPLLQVEHLTTAFHTGRGRVTAIDDVSFSILPGQTLGLVGESGCGKSVTALSIMRLLPPAAAEIVSGSIRFDGRELLTLPESAMRSVRGNDISMIFQEPMTSLNPVFRIGEQVAEAIRLHTGRKKQEAWDDAVALLRQVGIPAPERRAREYPHQMSGGMRQRVMIAMALACSPRLIIADEPTTALDVTIQGQILDLMRELAQTRNAALMLITHDLGVVAETAENVIVMYAGRIVEQAPVTDLFATPLHPYTQGLMRSIPPLPGSGSRTEDQRPSRLETIHGTVPPLHALPTGCTFSDRCPHAFPRCRESEPPMAVCGAHHVRCWLHEQQ